MRVAVLSQLPFCLAFGGLEIQLLRTAEALRSVGVEVEFLNPWAERFEADLLHCFGSEYQLAETVARASDRGIPVVVSSVFVPERPLNLYRLWRYVDSAVPMKTSFGARKAILGAADAVVALTQYEAASLNSLFGTQSEKIFVVPIGVEERFFTAGPHEFESQYGLEEFVLCVGSVESRKNQLRLLEALIRSDVPVVFVGESRAESQYGKALARRIQNRPKTLWIHGLPHNSSMLASAYAAAQVHVLPSLAEALPAVMVQAAAAGANLVASDLAPLRETFGSYVWYCEPRSITSIRAAVLEAYHARRGVRYEQQRPPWLHSWRDSALRLREVYKTVLDAKP